MRKSAPQKGGQWVWLVLLMAATVTVEPATIVSERSNLVSRNGRIYSNKTITVRCTQSDFGNPFIFTNLNSATNLTETINVTCGAPRISYSGNVVGQVPRNGKIVRREAPILRDPTRYDPEFVDGLNIEDQIKAIAGNADRGLLFWPAVIGVGIAGAAIAGAVMGGIALTKLGDLDAVPRAEFDQYVGTVNNLKVKLEDYNNKSKSWENNIINAFQNVSRSVDLINLEFEVVQSQFNATLAQMVIKEGTYNQSLRTIEAESVAQRAALDATNDKILDLTNTVAALTGAGNATLRQTMEIVNNFSVAVQSTLDSMQVLSDERMAAIDGRLLALSRALRQTQAWIREVTLRTTTRRHLTRLMLAAIQTTQANPDGFEPFLDDLGTQPASELGLYGTMAIDRQYLTYAYSSSGTLYAKQVELTYLCDTMFILNQATSYTSKRELTTYLGPVGCDDNVPGSCTCWAFLTERRCPVNASLLTEAVWLNRTTVNQSWCTSAMSVTRNEDQFFSGASLLDAMGSTICPDVFNGTARVATSMQRFTTDVAYYAVPGCTMLPFVLFETSPANVFDALFNQLVESYSRAILRSEVYMDYIDGKIPLNISVAQQPFSRVYGQNAEILEAAFMAYSPEMLNVSKYTNPSISTTVTVKVDNVTRNQSDIALSLPIGFVLEANLKFVGDPFSSTFVYDVDNEDLPLSPTASTREGSITYHMCLNMSVNCTLAQWRFENEATFNHYQGDNVAEIYRRQVNGALKRCNGTGYAQSGSVCIIMDNFFLEPAENGLVLEPREASYEVDIFLQEGLLTVIEFSDCPAAEVIPVSASGVVLALSNNRAVSIIVAIVEDNPNSGCDRTLNNVVVGAGLTYRHFVPACVNGGVTLASVFRYEGTDLIACEAAANLNVTINRPQFIQTQGAADALYVDAQTVAITDKTSLDLFKAMNELTYMVQQTLVATATMVHSTGLPIVNASYDLFNQIMSNATQIRDEIETLILTNRNRTALNISGLLDDMDSRLATERSRYDNLTNTSIALLNALRAESFNLSTSIAVLIEAKDELQRSRDAYVNATNVYLDAEVNLFGRILDSIDDFTDGGMGLKFLNGLVNVIKTGVGTVYDGVKTLVGDVVELGLKVLGGALGIFAGGLGMIVFIIIVVAAGIGFLGFIFVLIKLRGMLFGAGSIGAAASNPEVQAFLQNLTNNPKFKAELVRLGYDPALAPSIAMPTPTAAPTAGELRSRGRRTVAKPPTRSGYMAINIHDDPAEIERGLQSIERLSSRID